MSQQDFDQIKATDKILEKQAKTIKVVPKSPWKNIIQSTFKNLRYTIDENSDQIVFFPRPVHFEDDFKSFQPKIKNFGFVIFWKGYWSNNNEEEKQEQEEMDEWFDVYFKKYFRNRSFIPLKIEEWTDLNYINLKTYSRELNIYRSQEMEKWEEKRKRRRQRRKANNSSGEEKKNSLRF